MNKLQKLQLYREGWLPSEILAFARATAGDVPTGHIVHQEFAFNSRPFLATRRSRRNYIKNLKDIGWTSMEIKQKFVDWYRNPTNTPFLFVKLEYRAKRKLSDLAASYKLRARAKISRGFGRAYGRIFRKESRPQNLPKRPLYPTRPRIIRRRYR